MGAAAGVTERALQLVALITGARAGAVDPVMVTSFTRIAIVLSLLRSALGTQTAPPNGVIVSLAVFLTAFVMAPTFRGRLRTGIEPLIAGQIQPAEGVRAHRGPVPGLHAAPSCAKGPCARSSTCRAKASRPARRGRLHVLVPAFMISELRRAFEIGFPALPALSDHRPRGGPRSSCRSA
jgi:flagellar biosynthetic protein FliP